MRHRRYQQVAFGFIQLASRHGSDKQQPKEAAAGFLVDRTALHVVELVARWSGRIPPGELFRLAQVMAQVDPHKVRTCVVQGGIGTSSGGASIVLPFVAQARDMGNQIRHDATLSHCG